MQVQKIPNGQATDKVWTTVNQSTSKNNTPNKNKMHKVEQLFSNQFAAIDNANEDGGTKSGQNLQLVASHFAENMDQNSSSTPALVKNNILLSAHASKDMVRL